MAFSLTGEHITLLHALLPATVSAALQQPSPAMGAVAQGCAQLEASLAALVPFVPPPILDLRLADPTIPRLAGTALDGTILFVECSGFTRLLAQFAPHGRQGNEAFSTLVNHLFGQIVSDIAAHGGGLIKFGGNSLTAFFDAARLGSDHATLACQAALAIHADTFQEATGRDQGDKAHLQLRSAVHAGKLFAVEVGDKSHAELMLTGRAINRVVVAHTSAAPGEVVITKETLPYVKGTVHTQPKLADVAQLLTLAHPTASPHGSPVWQPDPPSEQTLLALLERIQMLQPYMPNGLSLPTTPLTVGQGEFRPVSVLFADFYALSKLVTLIELPALIEDDTAIIGRMLDIYYTHTQDIIQQYGGSISQIDMATFGNRLLATFGAPTAHDDDPARAVAAALHLCANHETVKNELHDLVQTWSNDHPTQRSLLRFVGGALRQRIGIATGTMFAGIVGTRQRHDYTVIGPTLHLAARLMEHANEGEVLVAEQTQRALGPLLEWHERAPLVIGGFEQPVPVVTALRLRDEDERAAMAIQSLPLIGRHDEVARLLDLAADSARPQAATGHVVSLVGEPGIGKSRLVDEVLHNVRTTFPHVLTIHETCYSYEQTTLYAPIARLLHKLIGVGADSDRDAQAQLVQQRLDLLVPEWSRFGPLLGPLLGLPLPETPLTSALMPEQRRDRLHDLVVMLCCALARQRPLVLVLDDTHWADASSIALVTQLASELADDPLLLLLVHRPLPDDATPWHQFAHSSTLRLAELTHQDCEALLVALLGQSSDDLRPLIERSHGLPLFLEETVRYAIESGAIQRDTLGNWRSMRPLDQLIPAQVEQLITARLDQLPFETRALAQIAAVIGPQFDQRLLMAIHGAETPIEQQLLDLQHAAIITPAHGESPLTYRFRHTMIRDVAYNNMLFAHRRELHGQVAAAMSAHQGDRLDDQQVVLAQHYVKAEQFTQAFPRFVAAAQHAQSRYANTDALALYDQALAVAPWHATGDALLHQSIAVPLYEQRGDVLTLIGSYVDARSRYLHLLELLNQPVAEPMPLQRATLQRKIGTTYEQQGDHEPALGWLQQALDTLAVCPASPAANREQGSILSEIGWIHFRRNAFHEAQQHLEQALALMHTPPAYDEQARILNRLGGVAWAGGDLVAARHYVERSLAAHEQNNNLIDQAWALNNLGLITGSQGLLDASISYGLQALALTERIGSRRMIGIVANNVGYALYDQGLFQQARVYGTQALTQARAIRDTYHQMLALFNLGRTLGQLGEWANAERLLQQSVALAAELQLPMAQSDIRVALAELALQQHHLPAALESYEACVALQIDTDSEEYGRFQRLHARLALVRGDRDEAERVLLENEALFAHLHNIPEKERTQRLRIAIQAEKPVEYPLASLDY